MDEFVKDISEIIRTKLINKDGTFDCSNEKEVDEFINCITKDLSSKEFKDMLNTVKSIEVCKNKMTETNSKK